MKLLKGICLFLLFVPLLISCSHGTKQEDGELGFNKQTHEESLQEKVRKRPLYLLLVGIDSRGEKQSRSDSMIILQYDGRNNSVKLASLMRDSYVMIPSIPNGSVQNKLNHAYYLGGEKLLRETVKQNFDISIDHVVTIDFQGFAKMVDLLSPEGIEVNVTNEMIDDMGFHLQPGSQYLHGDELLKYVRFRHDGESDFGRVARQQEVLVKIKELLVQQLKSTEGILGLPGIVNEGMGYIQSDLTKSQIISLSAKILLDGIDTVDTIRIPVQESYTNETYDHAGAVLQLDFEKNVEALASFFDLEESGKDNTPSNPL
ncbi:LCP family protein [Peribacillus alkalitolerans]|uniref:LCP family protein n=1 Tax=Peribacillus alkalitolerans TaxID=1550385 RepID=UPI0013D3AA7F|nr:LCP family protein [Peribacillus alkalitolerans]